MGNEIKGFIPIIHLFSPLGNVEKQSDQGLCKVL